MIVPPAMIKTAVEQALSEDIGSGDITAELIPEDLKVNATIISREDAVICGTEWVRASFEACDPRVNFTAHIEDGDRVKENTLLFEVEGNARALMTAERTALNFCQMLSGTATRVAEWVEVLGDSHTKLLDTRKTLPGHRLAQKYAVLCGGGQNHRLGLHDAFLIKENHIMACGGVSEAVTQAHAIAPGKPVEIEVEDLTQLAEAVEAGADIVMLDNFEDVAIVEAVKAYAGRVKFEVSGNVSKLRLQALSAMGIDYISAGALTKHVCAVDLSMRVVMS